MNTAHSQTSITSRLKDILYYMVPAWAVSIAILALSSAGFLIKILPGIFAAKAAPPTISIRHITQPLIEKLDKIPHIASIATFVFWMFTGIVVYLICVILFSFLYAARGEVDFTWHYVHPISVNKSSIIQEILFHWVLFISVIFTLVITTLLTIIVLLPVCRDLFILGFRNPHVPSAWLQTVASSLILSIALAAVLFLGRLTRRSFRLL